MLKYLLYPAFGLGVLGMYGTTAMGARDVTSVSVRRSAVPSTFRNTTNFAAVPIIWRTGFHGPSAFRPTPRSTGRGSSYRSGYGGSGFGK